MTVRPRIKRPAPLSIRLSDAELEALRRRAGTHPLSTYIKQIVFGTDAASARRSPSKPGADRVAIAQALARLGQARVASSLQELAQAARSGSLVLSPDTETHLLAACREIAGIRRLLMTALGIRVTVTDDSPRLSHSFTRSARRFGR